MCKTLMIKQGSMLPSVLIFHFCEQIYGRKTEFMCAGCPDRKNAVIALQVYLELCEVKRYWNVEYKFSETHKLLYFTAKKSKSDVVSSIFIPIDANSSQSFNKLNNYFTLCTDSDSKTVFLVFVSTDSTCVYYQITDGLFEPTDLTAKHLRENKQEKLDADIKRHRNLLEEAAVCGLPVNLPSTSAGQEKQQKEV